MRSGVRFLIGSLVAVLPLAVSCTVQTDEDRARQVVGSWKSPTLGTIQFLEDGALGEVSLPPSVCPNGAWSADTKFTGTWRPWHLDSVGPATEVTLTAAADGLKCDLFFLYSKDEGQAELGMAYAPEGSEPFVRQ
ncbi:hypothetical protein ACIQK5_04530 [Streptomyces virginiae]|uniref:hypothetical protein n=1 Tax=Streptomyces TaxID=1883 RepID=UPI001368D280|nr:hypothetical protein [Streptomyces sp. SID1046]MYV78391.1 hypothetical protein [Streptomyces sp. SID1046]